MHPPCNIKGDSERRDGKQNDERNVPKRGSSIQDSRKREPCKIMSLNTQGLINIDSKWKVDMIKEYVSVNNVIIMNFTETWLKEEDQDVGIPNYTTIRGDRKGGKTKGGGAAIYLKDGFEAKVLLEFGDGK